MQTKTCTKCNETKPILRFKHKGGGIRSSKCRMCIRTRSETSLVSALALGRADRARRRARKRGIEVITSAAERQTYRDAVELTRLTGIAFEVDHITPFAAGGTHCAENLQILTIDDHLAKTMGEQA